MVATVTRLLPLGLLAALAATASAAACTDENGPVVCTQCAANPDSNDIHGLPRVNTGLSAAPANWGAYTDTWTAIGKNCLGGSSDSASGESGGECDAAGAMGDVASPGPKEFGTYLQSVGMYAGFAVFMCYLCIVGFICCCFCRYCCCCRCKTCCCNMGSGCCGGRFPTRRGEGKCSCLGFVVDNDSGSIQYDKMEVWGTRILMWTYCFFIVLWISLGQFNGNEGFTTAMKAWAESPQGVVDLVGGAVDPLSNLIENIASDSVVGLLEGINKTIADGVDLTFVVEQMSCVIASIDNLPDVSVVTGFVDGVVDIFGSIQDEIGTIQRELRGLARTQTRIKTAIENLRYEATNITADINAIIPTLDASVAALNDVVNFTNTLVNPTDGIQAILDDFGSVSDPSKMPSAATIELATDSPPHSDTLADILGGNAAAATLIGKLQNLLTKFNALPDYDETANKMELYNRRIDNAQNDGLLFHLEVAINGTVDALDNMRGVTGSLNTTIVGLETDIRSMSLAGISTALRDIDNLIVQIDFAPVLVETAKVKQVPAVLPCMKDMATELLGFNDTVIELPDSVADITDMVDTVNASIVPALDSVDQVPNHAQTFDNQTSKVNITSIALDLDGMQVQVDDALANLDTSGMLGDLQTMEASFSLDLTIVSQLSTLNSTLQSGKMPDATVTIMRNFEVAKQAVLAPMAVIIADLQDYDSRGQAWECRGAPGTGCAADSGCTGPDQCLGDPTRYAALATQLTAVKNGVPDLSSETSSLNSVSGDTNINSGSFNQSVTDVKQSMADVDVGSFSSQLDDVKNGLDSFDTAAVADDFDAMGDDFEGIESQLNDLSTTTNDLNSTFADVLDQLEIVRDAQNMLETIHALLFSEMPVLLASLGKEELDQLSADHGIAAVVERITSVLDDITNFVSDGTDMLGDLGTDLTGDTVDMRDQIDSFTNPDTRNHGPLYFIMSMQGANGTLMKPADAVGGRISKDANGQAYPDDKECYTRECVNNEIDFMNSEPLGLVIGDLDGSGSDAGIPLSRTDIMGLPYIFPFLCMLLGFLASICFSCGKCASCCSRLSCCCIAIQMPCIFLFFGIFFVIVLFMGDFCYGFENAGYRIVSSSALSCDSMPGGVGDFDSCTFEIDALNSTATMNIGAVYKGILGGQCDVDPLGEVWTSLAASIGSLPSDILNPIIDDGLGSVALRQPLIDVIKDLGASVGTHLSTFILELGEGIGCKGLNGAYMGFKNALCCETLNAAYWALSAWYLIAFSFLLCGCTASVMGIKRFRRKLWGRHYQEALEEHGVGPAGGELEMVQPGADPYGGDNVPYDPYAQDPYAQDPYAQDPYAAHKTP